MRVKFWAILILSGLSSAFGLFYSQLLVKVLLSLSSNFMLSQTMTMGFFIASMGLGAYWSEFWKEDDIPRQLPRLQLMMAALGFISLVFVYTSYGIHKFYLYEWSAPRAQKIAPKILFSVILSAQLVTVLMGLISGLELNLLVRLGRQWQRQNGAARVLAGGYLGTMAASLGFIWIFPRLSPQASAFALSSLNVLAFLALYWILQSTSKSRSWTLPSAAMLLSVLLFGAIRNLPAIEQMELKMRELQSVQIFSWTDFPALFRQILAHRPTISRYNTGYQNIDIIFETDGEFRFLLDQHDQIERSWNGAYHAGLIHVPIQVSAKVPRDVLILGGGDGVAASELLKYGARIDHIDEVELDPSMISFSKNSPFFLYLNHNSFSDPKVTLNIMDALVFLRQNHKHYDAIFIDMPLPYETELVKLFSREFYEMVARHLKSDGYAVMDVPMGCYQTDPFGRNARRWRSGLPATLKAAGFRNVFAYCEVDGFLLARLDEFIPEPRFWDVGFPLAEVTEKSLPLIWQSPLPPARSKRHAKINTLFRPYRPLKNYDL